MIKIIKNKIIDTFFGWMAEKKPALHATYWYYQGPVSQWSTLKWRHYFTVYIPHKFKWFCVDITIFFQKKLKKGAWKI